MYMTELAPSAIRGALVNFYQSWLMLGAVVATAIVYGTSLHLQGQWAYKTGKQMPSSLFLWTKH